jgi:hypothetical protein
MEQELLEVVQVCAEEDQKFIREQQEIEQIQQILTQLEPGLQTGQVRAEEMWGITQKLTEIRRELFHSAFTLEPVGIAEEDIEGEAREDFLEGMRQTRELKEKMERRWNCHSCIGFTLCMVSIYLFTYSMT